MAHFIDIKQSRPATCMTKREFRACVYALHEAGPIDELFEPLFALEKAKSLMTEDVFDELKHNVLSYQYDFTFVLRVLFPLFTFCKMIFWFKVLGRQDITGKMLTESQQRSRLQVVPEKVNMPNKHTTHSLYVFWKKAVDNRCFEKCLVEIEDNIKDQNRKMTTMDTDVEELQLALDFKLVFCVLKYQQCDTRYKKDRLLLELLNHVPAGTEQRSVRMIYHGKKAITEAKEDNLSGTENHVTAAMEIAECCAPCFATVSLLHDILYSYRNICNYNHTRDNLDKVIYWGHLAIDMIKDELECVQVMWKRVFLQYMFLSLLRFNSVFEVIHGEVGTADLHMASNALEEMGRLLQHIPVRRKMIYCLTQARYFHLTEDSSKAKYYAEMSMDACDDGTYFDREKQNVTRFCEDIRRRHVLRQRVTKHDEIL